MTTLLLQPVPTVPPLETTWADADQVVTDVRAALGNVTDAQEWCAAGAGDWSGDAADAADHVQTTTARDLDVAAAAFERVAVAAQVFADEIQARAERREELVAGNDALTTRREALASRVATTEAEIAVLEADVRTFNGDVGVQEAAVTTWVGQVEETEQAFVRALQEVDTTAEAEGAADAPGRIDPAPLADHLAGLSGDPAAARRYWDGLSPAEQQALVTRHPEVVGNTDGLPVAVRDDANRAALARDLDYFAEREADGQLDDSEREHYENAQAVQQQVEEYAEEIDPITGENLLTVVGYEPRTHSDDGAAILAFGDPDVAEHVSTYVPGTKSEVSGIGGSVGNAHSLYEEALADGSGTVATLVWLDYDAPSADGFSPAEIGDIASVASSSAAEDAGHQLAGFLDGLRASRDEDAGDAHLTLVGHSYGATTAAWAAHDGAPVDDLVLLGSPGAPTSTAEDLTDADVYVGAADYDGVSLLGTGGRGSGVPAHAFDPAQASFGAERIEVAPGEYRIQEVFDGNHTSYFEGTSLDNVAAVVSGGDPTVVDGRSGYNYQTLSEVLGGSTAASGAEAAPGIIEQGLRNSPAGLALRGLQEVF